MTTSAPASEFTVAGPATPASPLVFDSPHSWRLWPEHAPAPLATPAQLDTSWDAWVDEIWAEATDNTAPVLAACFHRAYIDANRARDDIDPDLLREPWPGTVAPQATSRRGMGLIRRHALPGVPIYGQPLAVEDVQHRLQSCYDPYHARLEELIAAARAAHGFSVHIDCHSMKSVGNAMNEDNGRVRPDLVISDLEGRSADGRLVHWLTEHLRALGYSVGVNSPYRGAELVRRHGRPEAGCHSVQIEIKRSLYMDESHCERHAGCRHLVGDLGRFVRQLSTALEGELGEQLRPSTVPSPSPPLE